MIKTFSSRAGRLSDTNKKFLNLKSKAVLNSGEIPKTKKPVVIDIGFGDAQSFVKDVIENQDYIFIGIEPYKKGFARAIQFYEENKCKNLFLFNGGCAVSPYAIILCLSKSLIVLGMPNSLIYFLEAYILY